MRICVMSNALAMPRRRDVFQRPRTKILPEKIDSVPWMAKILKNVAQGLSVDYGAVLWRLRLSAALHWATRTPAIT